MNFLRVKNIMEIPEDLYFKILREANEKEVPIHEYLEGILNHYSDLEQSYENITDEELQKFTLILHQTILEILNSQLDIAKSDEGTKEDFKMVEVLNIIFARATRNKQIISECLREYYNRPTIQ